MKKLLVILGIMVVAILYFAPSILALQDPYIAEITVLDTDGNPVSGANVVITHLASDATGTAITDTNGWCYIPIDSFATYNHGDRLKIAVTKGTLFAEATVTVDTTTNNEWGFAQSLTLGSMPLVTTGLTWLHYTLIAIVFLGIIGGGFWLMTRK